MAVFFCKPQSGIHITCCTHMSYSLNSLKGDIWGILWGTTIGAIRGDTRSLDNGSYHSSEADRAWVLGWP